MPLRPFHLLKNCATIIQTLNLYVACGIVSFGWALSRLLDFRCCRYGSLWFFGAIFIYNVDRLKPDPADPINIPRRSRAASGLRTIIRALAALSALMLVLIPLFQKNFLMLFFTVFGALVCINYSLSPLGFRVKDIPLLKTLFAPTLVTAAFLIPPFLQQDVRNHSREFLFAGAWTFCVLLFNMVLCDLRDMKGDARMGIKSLPVLAGFKLTFIGLVAQLVLIGSISAAIIHQPGSVHAAEWRDIAIGMLIYLTALLTVMRGGKLQPESFYEWWVEGILFVPALIYTVDAGIAIVRLPTAALMIFGYFLR